MATRLKKQTTGANAERKIRTCLMCRTDFESEWSGERICRRCKASAAWRSG
jgi:hypothetical protein